MKLKYKKIILLTTMSTMGIGLLTLSLSHDKSDAKESLSPKAAVNSIATDETAVEEGIADTQMAATVTIQPSVSPTPTAVPTPTPLPVYSIEENGYPKITKLVKEYYTAKNSRDVKALKALLSDPTKADTQEELQQKTEYIDEYRNIKVYVKKGFEKGTYIVYAYHEIKFTGINTTAPSLSKFYVTTASDDTLKIFSGEMDEQTKAYYDERSNDKDVVAIMDMTNQKSKDAMKKDEDLKNFWDSVAKMANNKQSDTQAQGDTN
ncbi:MAG TPA: hypothetical protein VN258_02330 [Mobilitalea sp.]|nr:hypothetical protein [Mobilitalea sp.]